MIDLGIAVPIEPHLLYSLRSHYFPIGKIGGKPSWLNPVHLPFGEALSCRVCGKQMAFLLQIYTGGSEESDQNFHRTVYMFICISPSCSQANNASNIRVFRCQLPIENPYYSTFPLDPDKDGDVLDPYANSTYPKLCEICGCLASSRCGRCQQVWYCHKNHQEIDWSFAHKAKCGAQLMQDSDSLKQKKSIGQEFVKPLRVEAINPFVFPEYGIRINGEQPSYGANSESEDSDEDNDVLEQRLKDYREYVSEHQLSDENIISATDCETIEDSIVKDVAFRKFSKHVSSNCEHILRHNRDGSPLIATDHAPYPDSIPSCGVCGGSRSFEFQLMPHLLSLLSVDSIGASIDWATVLVYTCSSNCRIENAGYSEEYVFKQDFK